MRNRPSIVSNTSTATLSHRYFLQFLSARVLQSVVLTLYLVSITLGRLSKGGSQIVSLHIFKYGILISDAILLKTSGANHKLSSLPGMFLTFSSFPYFPFHLIIGKLPMCSVYNVRTKEPEVVAQTNSKILKIFC